MARFKCKNCGETFIQFVSSGLHTAICPKCHSSWTIYLGPDDDHVWPRTGKFPYIRFQSASTNEHVAWRSGYNQE